jgi:DNA-binding winged helix-turn-helix (wHTH) protein
MKVRFEGFQIDSDTRQLSGTAGEIRLSPKAFELLLVLVVARPRALSKAELQRHLWPDTFVTEANLPLLVSEIRAAIGDSARAPRFVRTVARFGYAFSAATLDDRTDAPAIGSPCCLVIGSDSIPLKEGVTVLGRDPDADVTVNVSGVSRLHARISVTASGAMVEDLNSKNGTFLRGERVTAAAVLSNGDEIRLGPIPLTFRTVTAASTTETQQSSSAVSGERDARR